MSGPDLRDRHMATARALLPPLTARLDWPRDRLAAYRDEQLRALVRLAAGRSPWHRERLAGVDVERLGAEGIDVLPVMTKAGVMANWDRVVTDRRLTLTAVNAHLGQPDGGYLLDRYTAVASGGSTGVRGVFVYDWEGLATTWVATLRRLIRALETEPGPAGPTDAAWVMAGHFSHVSAAVARTFADPRFVSHRFPPTLPVAGIVAGLNRTQPRILAAYPSLLHVLTHEAAAGRLLIAPGAVVAGGEPLLPEIRQAAEAAWGLPVQNLWSASEGCGLAAPCPLGERTSPRISTSSSRSTRRAGRCRRAPDRPGASSPTSSTVPCP